MSVLVGVVVMATAMFFDYRLLSSLVRPLYVVTIVLLGIVLLVGDSREGAQSWFALGNRTLQPSEPAKLLLVVVLAAYFARFEDKRETWVVQTGGLVLAGIPLLMVLVQPDLGTATVFAIIWLVMAWSAGIRWPYLLLLVLLATLVFYIGWTEEVLSKEQKVRLTTFYWLMVDPSKVDRDEGYNITQALTAIGSGGLFGTGLTQGVMTQGSHVPVQHSDFILSVIGEELGFVGGVVLLLFQALLLWITLTIASRARDTFGRLIAVGVFGLFFSHLLVNGGMAMGLMPVTGLPMPFISAGGTFTITMLAAIGLLQSVAMRWRKISF
jgi:rod shape determining protein RodA